jgi:hypothetical protein
VHVTRTSREISLNRNWIGEAAFAGDEQKAKLVADNLLYFRKAWVT